MYFIFTLWFSSPNIQCTAIACISYVCCVVFFSFSFCFIPLAFTAKFKSSEIHEIQAKKNILCNAPHTDQKQNDKATGRRRREKKTTTTYKQLLLTHVQCMKIYGAVATVKECALLENIFSVLCFVCV